MDNPFYPDGHTEKYILLVMVHHPRHNTKTMQSMLGTDPAPYIESMKRRGLVFSKENGLYMLPDEMRRRVIDGLNLSGV